MDFSQVFSIRVSLYDGNSFAARLLHDCRIGSSNSFRIRIIYVCDGLAWIQESVRVSTDDNIYLRTVFGDLLVFLVSGVSEGNDNIDALCL